MQIRLPFLNTIIISAVTTAALFYLKFVVTNDFKICGDFYPKIHVTSNPPVSIFYIASHK